MLSYCWCKPKISYSFSFTLKAFNCWNTSWLLFWSRLVTGNTICSVSLADWRLSIIKNGFVERNNCHFQTVGMSPIDFFPSRLLDWSITRNLSETVQMKHILIYKGKTLSLKYYVHLITIWKNNSTHSQLIKLLVEIPLKCAQSASYSEHCWTSKDISSVMNKSWQIKLKINKVPLQSMCEDVYYMFEALNKHFRQYTTLQQVERAVSKQHQWSMWSTITLENNRNSLNKSQQNKKHYLNNKSVIRLTMKPTKITFLGLTISVKQPGGQTERGGGGYQPLFSEYRVVEPWLLNYTNRGSHVIISRYNSR